METIMSARYDAYYAKDEHVHKTVPLPEIFFNQTNV
jgi:hypothetical protein